MHSEVFDDIYFSTEDGLAESRHTYLAGNDLPQAWQGKDRFHILELGFGSGLNFLATLRLWRETALPQQHLHYTAIELYPVPWPEIERGLAQWRDELVAELALLQRVYRAESNLHFTAQITGSVTLELLCMDVGMALPQVSQSVNAFYLDGFAPAKNPDMWSAPVFMALARLSRTGSTFATFTVARGIRETALAAGFEIQKIKGYGRKAEMLVGRYSGI